MHPSAVPDMPWIALPNCVVASNEVRISTVNIKKEIFFFLDNVQGPLVPLAILPQPPAMGTDLALIGSKSP